MVVIGHSAGGQLALWLAARSKLPPSSAVYTKDALPLKAIVDIDGLPDLAAAQPVERRFGTGDPVITRFKNGTPAEQPQALSRKGRGLPPLGSPAGDYCRRAAR